MPTESESRADLADAQEGPLAEAAALADAINIITTDNLQMRDDSLAVLSRMLLKRLDRVRGVVQEMQDVADRLPSDGGAA